MPTLRAASFSRRTCVRCPLGSRLGVGLLVFFAMDVNSLGYEQHIPPLLLGGLLLVQSLLDVVGWVDRANLHLAGGQAPFDGKAIQDTLQIGGELFASHQPLIPRQIAGLPVCSPSKTDHTRLGDQVGEPRSINKRGVQGLEVLFSHPTGDRARPSNIHRNVPLDDFVN
jgi:hypothetical protein